MHHPVPGRYLRTTFAESPSVHIIGVGGSTSVSMTFAGSSLQEPGGAWMTTLEFNHVLHFAFHDWEIGLPLTDSDDYAFALIEMESSVLLNDFVTSGALKQTASPVTTIDDLNHYRIGFDDHGTYEIVCVSLSIGNTGGS